MYKDLKELLEYSHTIKILLIEDNSEVKSQLIKLLKNFFTDIDSCDNGIEALQKYINYEKIYGNFYDLIITDISVPGLNGIELSKKLLQCNPKQAILVTSAYIEKFNEFENIGVYEFLEKPIDYEKMVKTFTSIIKRLKQS